MSKWIIKTAVDCGYLTALLALPTWLTGLFEFPTSQGYRWFVVITFVVLVGILGGLPSHWRNPMNDGRPTAFYRSRRRPPWAFPREVSSLGSRTERADFRLLVRRLVKIKKLPLNPQIDWEAPILLRDPVTGQYWRQELHEAGFNQWHVLVPVERNDITSGAPTRAPD